MVVLLLALKFLYCRFDVDEAAVRDKGPNRAERNAQKLTPRASGDLRRGSFPKYSTFVSFSVREGKYTRRISQAEWWDPEQKSGIHSPSIAHLYFYSWPSTSLSS
jgi:hypothetical protein